MPALQRFGIRPAAARAPALRATMTGLPDEAIRAAIAAQGGGRALADRMIASKAGMARRLARREAP